MTKLRVPLFSLLAQGRLGDALAFRKRKGSTIAESKPVPRDAKTSAQLAWRTMYQMAAALWHDLTAAEKAVWESQGTTRHMTGYAWFMSQALRPNPGIYLPLVGGTMQGDIDMATHGITSLPDPTNPQDAATKAIVDALEARYQIGARVYNNANIAIPWGAWTALTFNSEWWDNDAMHDPDLNPSRITIRTAGKYLIGGGVQFAINATGNRALDLIVNGVTSIAMANSIALALASATRLSVNTAWQFSIGDFVELFAYQDEVGGAPLNVEATPARSPEFWAHKLG